jgi:non-specific protein-tyrosine kinase
LFNTMLAALVGALLGLGVAFLIEYLDDTVKTPDNVRDLTGLATLGGVVKLEGATPSDRLVASASNRSPSAEAYRVLRTNLQFSSLDKPLSTLVLTSATPGEGKSTTAANLAIVLAQAEKRVILVDADLRRPSIHKIFRLPNHTGLSTALLDKQHDPATYLQDTDVPCLRVLVTGPIPPNPAEMLSSSRMLEVIETLKGEADVVIFDMPPVLAVADASILAGRVDGTLLVVGVGEVRGEMLVQAVERLESVGVHPLGAVLNKLTERKSGYYYYYYYQYASRYETDANGNPPKSGGRRGRRARRTSSQPDAGPIS